MTGSRTNSTSHDDCESADAATGNTRWRARSGSVTMVEAASLSPPAGSQPQLDREHPDHHRPDPEARRVSAVVDRANVA
nr:hypothetical protein GCM10020093_032790 [Planobispora longispora]